MILLRLIALVAAVMVLFAPPLLAANAGHGSMPAWMAVGGLTGMGLVALSFAYVAALGDRMRRPGHVRTLGALLLLIPAVAGATLLATRHDAALLTGGGALLAFTVVLFVSFIFPGTQDRRQRPMRKREQERREPSLILVQRNASTERRSRA